MGYGVWGMVYMGQWGQWRERGWRSIGVWHGVRCKGFFWWGSMGVWGMGRGVKGHVTVVPCVCGVRCAGYGVWCVWGIGGNDMNITLRAATCFRPFPHPTTHTLPPLSPSPRGRRHVPGLCEDPRRRRGSAAPRICAPIRRFAAATWVCVRVRERTRERGGGGVREQNRGNCLGVGVGGGANQGEWC